MKMETNYFVSINRILTNVLSGLIGAATGFGIYFGSVNLLNINIADLNSITFILFIVLSFSLFVSNLVFQMLQNYFCKILEKDKYSNLAKKLSTNLIANILVGIIIIPLTFALYSQSANAGVIALFIQAVFAFVMGIIVREDNKTLTMSSLFGVVLAALFSILIVFIAKKQSLGLGVTAGLISTITLGVLSSCTELVGLILNNLVKTEETPEVPVEQTTS